MDASFFVSREMVAHMPSDAQFQIPSNPFSGAGHTDQSQSSNFFIHIPTKSVERCIFVFFRNQSFI
jgi:hypothetical protein